MQIEDWRAQIDVLDHELVYFAEQASQLVSEITAQKRRDGLAFRDIHRERQILFRGRRAQLGTVG